MILPGQKKIILASGSPRRKEIMEGMGLVFEVDTENSFKEEYSPDTPHEKIPELMSQGKSHGFHRPLAENEILITSDTMVMCRREILGKPKDREDAIRMLRLLSGCLHRVITAVTIRDSVRETTFSDTSYVHFKELSDSEIEYYVDTCRPYDKAGAYAIQEWIGYTGITKIDGSYYTIMGLPAHRLYSELQKFM
ncbi:MAG: septum formation protein Maf [Bacteroidetes bacterium]|uniref:dTTP/UTP pyrophosphatase n=1 Tax=Candidatus Cryptobacteroides avicola TaxID=2840757 RepID=A0A940IJ86_9BACT|nr:septum formation protein Maf [Candidatus Cryptobacteroides avicola]